MSYTLRDLPLPVKVVATVFLLAVGVGYTSAMVQVHMQTAKGGTPMPTMEDVILKYTGKKEFKGGEQPRPVCRLEALIMGPIEGELTAQTMGPAFFGKDPRFVRQMKENPAMKAQLEAERNGEREVLRWWINADDAKRKEMYDQDKCVMGADKAPKQITGDFLHDDGSFKIKSIIEVRCARCHSQGGQKPDVPLETYDEIKAHLAVAPFVPVKPGDYMKVQEPISMEKLTQSTHAHLLSFSMLFSLTGLVFAFSSWPKWMRCILSPLVVIAMFTDVSFWWLARLCDEWGPYFAMGIIGTGMVAGAGLFAQIVLSLFDLYGWKGKIVIAGLLLLGAGIAGLVWVNKIDPALKAKANLPAPQPQQPKPENKKVEQPKNGSTKPNNGLVAVGAAIVNGITGKTQVAKAPVSQLDQLLSWPPVYPNGKLVYPNGIPADLTEVKLNGEEDGNMALVFFEREKGGAFRKKMEDPDVPQQDKDKLRAERQGDLDAMRAW
ncbi:MAG: hypothetical protein L0241_30855, partial [Planctomycetia bacterium]|nr:hypothetical protein [Planctomycetia bacterium]